MKSITASVTRGATRRVLRDASRPLHPWLFALFPLLSLYVANWQAIPILDMLRPVAIVLALTGLVWLASWAALGRDAMRSAVLTSGIVFWLFAYGHLTPLYSHIQDLLAVVLPSAYSLSAAACVMPLWLLVFVAIPILAVRIRSAGAPVSAVLQLTGAVLILLPLLALGVSFFRARTSPSLDPAAAALAARTDPRVVLAGSPPTTAAPDIYFVVVDAYGRQDVLRHFYDFDNGPFVRELEKRGFFVARKGRANYDQTVLCLAAALGMHYPDDIARRESARGTDVSPLWNRIDSSPAAAFLKARGYNYISITTGFPWTAANSADLLLGSSRPRENLVSPFEGLLIGVTPLGLMPRVSESLYDQHREYLDLAWRHLADVANLQPNRKFVFAHILAPHPPFVFGPHGEPVNPKLKQFSLDDGSNLLRYTTRAMYRRGYIAQLRYVNQRTLDAIDAILAASRVRPIIVLIGDHGPRQYLDFDSLDDTDPRECFGNLSAYLLPDGSAQAVYGDDISAVNAFRLLFDHYFGASYPRLPDRSYYSRAGAPYDFTDVTARTTLSSSP